MKVFGIDFTSTPSRKKPITCLECELQGAHLIAGDLVEWVSFDGFEKALLRPGLWIAGLDFPFGQARRFIETIDWPRNWEAYVSHAASLGKTEFEAALNNYANKRPAGDKHHFRQDDRRTGSQSPQKLHFIPVAKMFFQGTPRLIKAGVTIPGLCQGEPDRIVVEAYPGVLARYLIGKRPYKADTKKRQTAEKEEARVAMLREISSGKLKNRYGLTVTAPSSLADDPTGDHLDALLCAIQAAWSWSKRGQAYGMPKDTDLLEGWIADPIPSR